MKLFRIILLLGLSSGLLVSCDPLMVYDQFKSTGNENWSWQETMNFQVDVKDSTKLYNIYIGIRHTKDYPKSNLFVSLRMEAPNESLLQDTIDIPIASKSGKWLGHGFGNIKLIRYKYREAVKFAQTGIYTIQLEQVMRLDEVPVTDVGIRIEEYKSIK